MGYDLGWDDVLNIPTAGGYGAVKYAAGGENLVEKGADAIGEGVKDYGNVGKNNFKATPYQGQDIYWGGDPGMADKFSNIAQGNMGNAMDMANWANGQAMEDRGPQAWEDQTLSNREASARDYDQAGAMQLAREAAMGQAPSEAAYMMQAGLNNAVAGQQSAAGSARGAAALANAQSNAQANTAALQNQAFTQAGQLRANEMAQARGAYGGLAGQMREQDLHRLQMGNDMSNRNADRNDAYKGMMMQGGNAYGTQGQGWYKGAMEPYNNQADLNAKKQALDYSSYNNAQDLNAGVDAAEAARRQQEKQMYTNMVVKGADTFGQAIPKGGGGGGMGGT